jgi:hypothetical protein
MDVEEGRECAHRWIDPQKPGVCVGKPDMEPGRAYRCERCGAAVLLVAFWREEP